MKGGHTGNPAKFSQEKACEPLGNGPVGMDQIKLSFLGNPESVGELGEDERGQLHESHGAFLHVFQYPRTVT